jgi:hypothetical protein
MLEWTPAGSKAAASLRELHFQSFNNTAGFAND